MEDHIKRLFLEEIDKQLNFSKFALENMQKISNDIENGVTVGNEKSATLFWYSTQSLLVSLANISKILYPVKSKYKKRGEILRRELSIDSQNIFKDRQIRNSFEHYDEHIDDFYSEIKSGSIFIDSTMAEVIIEDNVGMAKVFMRNYVPKDKRLTFKDLSLELNAVEESLEDLTKKLDSSLSKFM